MGRTKIKKSLIQQVKATLDSKLAIGQSKHAAKRNGTHTHYIYSWDTYRSYLKHGCYFVRWVKDQPIDVTLGHKPRTLAECRGFAELWIQDGIDRGLSAYTIKLQVSALAKLYGCTSKEFDIVTPSRKRNKITRSRGAVEMDKHFSSSANKDLIAFCKCTGLRRAELAQIRGTDLVVHEGHLCLDVRRGTKGGRIRISPVCGSEREVAVVKKLCALAGSNKIFPKPSKNADIHSYRAAYAKRVYDANKREYGEFKKERLIVYKNTVVDSYITKNGRRDPRCHPHLYIEQNGVKRMLPGYRDVPGAFYCRHDMRGTVYDRKALFAASLALGHRRESIVAEHYLY